MSIKLKSKTRNTGSVVSHPSEATGTKKQDKRASSKNARQSTKRSHVDIFLVSEMTGGLARHIISVVLSQFSKLEYDLHEHPLCSSANELRNARLAIEKVESPIVFSALARPRLKKSLATWCERKEIDHFDLMQSIVEFVSSKTLHKPIHDASRTHRCDEEYYRRMEAWEFTLQHDDSRRLETVGQADLILVGVSRVGKTPLAAYLGSLGFRVGNVSISHKCQIPPQVGAHREKTIGLTIDPDRLAEIRERRFEKNGLKGAIRKTQGCDSDYYSHKTALRDVVFAERQFRKLGIRKLDVTDSTIEETAVRILKVLDLQNTH